MTATRGDRGGGRAGPVATGGRLSVWPPLPPGIYLRKPAHELPFPFGQPGCRLVAWARHGLWHGVRALGLTEGDEILAPAYHHGSEIESLIRAGLVPRFYDITTGRDPDQSELEALIGPRTRALHLTHYLGLPSDAARWRKWCDERGLLLIEDAAQAWLGSLDGRPVGSFGDLAVFCLYKTFGLPEGAAMISPDPPRARPLDPRSGVADVARRHGAWLAARSRTTARLSAPLRRRRVAYDPEADFALRDPADMPWASTLFLLRRVVDPEAPRRRRARYRALLERLGDRTPASFRALPDGASPFAFPLATPDKALLLAELRARGVEALDFWAAPHPSLPVAEFPGAAALRASVLGLPVHQELRDGDLARIADAAAS